MSDDDTMPEAECPCGFLATARSADEVATMLAAHTCPQPYQRHWWQEIEWDLGFIILPVALIIICGALGSIFGGGPS